MDRTDALFAQELDCDTVNASKFPFFAAEFTMVVSENPTPFKPDDVVKA